MLVSRLRAKILVTALLMVASAAAAATEILRSNYQSAAGLCQGALPAFSGTLRARPLAIGNEGGTTAFLTCALQVDNYSPSGANAIYLRAANLSAAPLQVTCTLVNGFGGSTSFATVYVPKTITIAAESSSAIIWEPGDLGLGFTAIRFPQISCSLPPGGAVYYISLDHLEDVTG